METTLIIMRIVTSIAYTVLIGLAISAYFYLRRQQQDMKDIKRVLARLFAITVGEHLRSNFDHLNEMKEALQKLVENEQYEDAKRMQAIITEQERQAMKALHSFQDEFGDDVVKMVITKVGKPANEEED